MKIAHSQENVAILSNVGQVGEFRIRNSAKAFSILSSGLYANKIKAIIREYSCNAYDAHVEAGKADCPFDVHLPNSLEPWFAVRDYGVGLNHKQVEDIFTTYFESTKTETDDLIGGLGLGSKSAFSYTDNFAVTAVKDGRKGIYTAFIAENGVPSIALMHEEDSDEPNGVEIKFSVNEGYDFHKFTDEARTVYQYFKTKPVVSGVSNFQPHETEYETKDIAEGIHAIGGRGYRRHSVAVMGNIAYPIQVPNAETNLGQDLSRMLDCGLEMHFAIGELDIQASREGLSYIPETIAAIKRKLQTLADRLEQFVADEVDAVEGEWAKALFLIKKSNSPLFAASVAQYVANNDLPLLDTGHSHHNRVYAKEIQIDVVKLKELNIALSGFSYAQYRDNCKPLKMSGGSRDDKDQWIDAWVFQASAHHAFVVQDTKVSCTNRAKYHFRNDDTLKNDQWSVSVLAPADKTKPMKTDEFFALLHNPPKVFAASELLEKPKEKTVRNQDVTILKLTKRGSSSWSYRVRDNDLVWREHGTLASCDAKAIHYYLPLKGWSSEFEGSVSSAQNLARQLENSGIPAFQNMTIFGVRKSDIEEVKKRKNWINLEKFIVDTLKSVDNVLISSMAASHVDASSRGSVFQRDDLLTMVKADSPFVEMVNSMKAASKARCDYNSLTSICTAYTAMTSGVDIVSKVKEKEIEYRDVYNRYPLLQYIGSYTEAAAIVEYIDLIDAAKAENKVDIAQDSN
jgi:hypothetical protein